MGSYTRSDKGGSFLRGAYVPTGTGKDTRGGPFFMDFFLFFAFLSVLLPVSFYPKKREEKKEKGEEKKKKRRRKA